jgi:hypothetical protein
VVGTEEALSKAGRPEIVAIGFSGQMPIASFCLGCTGSFFPVTTLLALDLEPLRLKTLSCSDSDNPTNAPEPGTSVKRNSCEDSSDEAAESVFTCSQPSAISWILRKLSRGRFQPSMYFKSGPGAWLLGLPSIRRQRKTDRNEFGSFRLPGLAQ